MARAGSGAGGRSGGCGAFTGPLWAGPRLAALSHPPQPPVQWGARTERGALRGRRVLPAGAAPGPALLGAAAAAVGSVSPAPGHTCAVSAAPRSFRAPLGGSGDRCLPSSRTGAASG